MRLIDADELIKVATEDWFLDMIAAQDSKSAVRKDIENLIDSVPLAEITHCIIDNDYCWQSCACTERCKECRRLCDGDVDYYESIDNY